MRCWVISSFFFAAACLGPPLDEIPIDPVPEEPAPVPSICDNGTLVLTETFARTAGPPSSFEEAFNTSAPSICIRVLNGSANGQNRVSSVRIFVDGEDGHLVAAPSDFNQQVSRFDRQLTVGAGSHVLNVYRLAGAPRSRLTVEVYEPKSVPALTEITAQLLPQLEALGAAHGFAANDTWVLRSIPLIDALGRVVARFDRYHHQLPVIGGDVVLQAAFESGLPVQRLISRIVYGLQLVLLPAVSELGARANAEQYLPVASTDSAQLVIWAIDQYRDVPRLAWDVALGPAHVIIAADDGSLLDRYSTTHTAECGDGLTCRPASATLRTLYAPGVAMGTVAERFLPGGGSEFALEDIARQIRVLDSAFPRSAAEAYGAASLFGFDPAVGQTVTSDIAEFGNSALFNGSDPEMSADRGTPLVDLYKNLGRTYQFFADKYGRFGFNGRSSPCLDPVAGTLYACLVGLGPIRATGNVPNRNASYDSRRGTLRFGYDLSTAIDADGPLVELDIVAHEYTHAVIDNTANILYNEGQSGAMNESLADVFGRAAQFYYDPLSLTSPQAWWLGSRAKTAAFPNDVALRYLDDPTRDGMSIDHAADYPVGGLDPHYGSGVPNRAFVNLTLLTGWEVAADIWYHALISCFTTSTTYSDARACTIEAADDLFPPTGPDEDTGAFVHAAWGSVGVF